MAERTLLGIYCNGPAQLGMCAVTFGDGREPCLRRASLGVTLPRGCSTKQLIDRMNALAGDVCAFARSVGVQAVVITARNNYSRELGGVVRSALAREVGLYAEVTRAVVASKRDRALMLGSPFTDEDEFYAYKALAQHIRGAQPLDGAMSARPEAAE